MGKTFLIQPFLAELGEKPSSTDGAWSHQSIRGVKKRLGVMIAWQGYVDKKRAKKSIKNLKPTPYINVESDI